MKFGGFAVPEFVRREMRDENLAGCPQPCKLAAPGVIPFEIFALKIKKWGMSDDYDGLELAYRCIILGNRCQIGLGSQLDR